MNISIELSAIISGSILIIFWLAGLSFSTNQNKKDIERLFLSHRELSDELRNQLTSMNKSLARIEGRLGRHESNIDT